MNTYYGDLTETWSNFSLLVDTAALLHEQEHKPTCYTEKKKTVSQKEDDEQRMKRIFHLFRRKPRSSSFPIDFLLVPNREQQHKQPQETCRARRKAA
ncbi:BnaA09g14210D [Brassica napus]|uniref:BnaA09g14210D protein n=1 Tax=Brassica napus TaxID=3708 RepID=A0A078ITE8_BRANA|nr:BnaA09g14210D [Brassica napus]